MLDSIQELLQRACVLCRALTDRVEIPDDVKETAAELHEDIGQAFDRDRENQPNDQHN